MYWPAKILRFGHTSKAGKVGEIYLINLYCANCLNYRGIKRLDEKQARHYKTEDLTVNPLVLNIEEKIPCTCEQ